MSVVRKIVALSIRGAVAGALLAVIAPTKMLDAGCRCDDFGSGSYTCNYAQTQCLSGNETCNVNCS